MSVFLAVIAAIFCVFGCFVRSKGDRSKSSEEGVKKSDENEEMAKSFSHFALSFLRTASNNEHNFLFSPVALGLNLTVIMEGSTGRTHEEIRCVLGKDCSHGSIQMFFSSVLRLLSTSWAQSLFHFFSNSVETSLASAFFVHKRFPLERSFSNRIQKLFKASARNVDFEEGDESAKIVNEYVCKKTNGMVREIVSAEYFGPLTHSLLVSTIHFEGRWVRPFNQKRNKQLTFYGLVEEKQKIFLYKEFNFEKLCFSISDGLTTVLLPYQSSGSPYKYSFAALMPSGDFGEWKNSLTAEKMREAIEGTKEDHAFLWMPKFEMECTMSLKEELEKMGVKQLFAEESGDLNGISKDLHLAHIIQKAAIEVHELGTRAGAVQASRINVYCLRPEIKIDHPFLFLVLRDDIPLFVGQYV